MAKILFPLLLIMFLISCNGATKREAQRKFKDSVDKAEIEKYYADIEARSQSSKEYSENYKAPDKTKSKAKINRVEYKVNKTNSYKTHWITYYVENFTDDANTYDKIEDVAYSAVKDSKKDFVNIYFFKNKQNIPKLDKNGKGWAEGYSQNQFNALYGKDCIGYYYKDGGTNAGTFSKGWY